MKQILLLFIILLSFFSLNAQNSNTETYLLVFLVRHAEKVDNSRDPELSEAGKERAMLLAKTLADSEIGHIHSTDFIRTKNTAQPIANLNGLEIETYNANTLQKFAEQLKNKGGRHLVVGHSNTTPQLVEMLGGEAGIAINEKYEYDRLYIVSVDKSGTINTILLRYGK